MRKRVFVGVSPAGPDPSFLLGGANPQRELVAYGAPKRPMWPDVPFEPRTLLPLGAIAGGTSRSIARYVRAAGVVAVCLAPETDWDLVRVYADDDDAGAQLLSPGAVVHFDEPATALRFEPAFQAPVTRFSTALGEFQAGASGRAKPSLPAGQAWHVDGANHIVNDSGAPVQTYYWDGTAWLAGDVIAPAGNVTVNAGVDAVLANQAASTGVGQVSKRPADVSPDGVNNFAELINAGVITLAGGVPYTGGLFVSQKTWDSNGNGGDVTNPTTAAYQPAYLSQISSYWYGRLHVELWLDEPPPCGYVPRLPSERVLTLPEMSLGGNGSYNALVTVPGHNVADVKFLFTARDAGHDVQANIAYPQFDELIFAPANVRAAAAPDPIPTSLNQATAEACSTAGIPENHELIQVIAGGVQAGTAFLKRGARLSLRRAFCG